MSTTFKGKIFPFHAGWSLYWFLFFATVISPVARSNACDTVPACQKSVPPAIHHHRKRNDMNCTATAAISFSIQWIVIMAGHYGLTLTVQRPVYVVHSPLYAAGSYSRRVSFFVACLPPASTASPHRMLFLCQLVTRLTDSHWEASIISVHAHHLCDLFA